MLPIPLDPEDLVSSMLNFYSNTKPAELPQPIVRPQDIFTVSEDIPPGETRQRWIPVT